MSIIRHDPQAEAAEASPASHPRDTYLAVLRLLAGLTTHELHALRVFDIPSEQQRRRGVKVSEVPVGSNVVNSVRG